MSLDQKLAETLARIEKGGAPKYHAKNAETGKLFARERIARLVDPGTFVEDAALANNLDPELPADGVITGTAQVDGRTVAIMANDSTVKAGSWGKRTVEKILRIQETARRLRVPMLYLVDSAGARITDQIEMFPGRRGAGRIFYNEVQMSGVVPQVCLLFGPSAAGGAYIPAFCDVVAMVDGNASMYLGSPRMARDGHRREGDARGDGRREDALLGLRLRRRALQDRGRRDRLLQALPRLLPASNCEEAPPAAAPRRPEGQRQDASKRSSRPTRTSRST